MELNSKKWGRLTAYNEGHYVTVYAKTADHLYKFFSEHTGEPVKWGNYIFGRRSMRFDFEITDWDELNDEARIVVLDRLIQKEYDDDELYGFHVEPIEYKIADFSNYTDKELFEEVDGWVDNVIIYERKLHKAKKTLSAVELELSKRDIDW